MGCTHPTTSYRPGSTTKQNSNQPFLDFLNDIQNVQTFSIQKNFSILYDWKIFSQISAQIDSFQVATLDEMKIQYKNGQTYIGEHRNGKRSGQGKLIFGNRSLEGLWEKDKARKGILQTKNRFKYDGQFRDNLPHGKGQLFKRQNLFYKGAWVNGKPEGKGRINFANEMYYEGKFKEGNLDGEGHFVMKGIAQIKGSFKKNQLNGVAKLTGINGHSYEGEWKENKKQGKGIQKWSDGSVYDGHFSDSKRNGYGVLKTEKGEYAGHWKNDALNEEGTLKLSEGNQFFVKTTNRKTKLTKKQTPQIQDEIPDNNFDLMLFHI